jgi:hypothetical protein
MMLRVLADDVAQGDDPELRHALVHDPKVILHPPAAADDAQPDLLHRIFS